FSPGDGKMLATATGKGKVRLWNVAGRSLVAELGSHASAVWSLAFSPDGATLASGSSDRTAKLWNVAERKEIATLETAESPAPPAKTDVIRLCCNGCGKALKANAAHVGRKLRCPYCQHAVEVPAPAEAASLAQATRPAMATFTKWRLISGLSLVAVAGAGGSI